jgi:hypothetical protein
MEIASQSELPDGNKGQKASEIGMSFSNSLNSSSLAPLPSQSQVQTMHILEAGPLTLHAENEECSADSIGPAVREACTTLLKTADDDTCNRHESSESELVATIGKGPSASESTMTTSEGSVERETRTVAEMLIEAYVPPQERVDIQRETNERELESPDTDTPIEAGGPPQDPAPGRLETQNDWTIDLKSLRFVPDYKSWGLIAAATASAVFAIIYWTTAVESDALRVVLWNSPSLTLFTIGALSLLTVSFLDTAVISACERLRWSMCSRPSGLRILDFIALSGSTSALGQVRLLTSPRVKGEPGVRFVDKLRNLSFRLWSTQR